MNKYLFLLLITFFNFLFSHSHAQIKSDTIDIYLIETRDGNQYIGEILYRDSESVILKTEQLGEINIKRKDIKRIELVKTERMIGEEYWFENPQATRYFWSPNGYGLKKGEGYYQNVWILFNQFSVGITDNVSLGAGFVPLFLFGGAPTPVWITPKVSVPLVKDKFNIGIGALAGAVISVSDGGGTFGILYGTTTFGSRDKNVSLGLGYGFIDGKLADIPAINIGVMIRTGKRGYFLSENYIIPTDPTLVLLSFGGRSIIQKVGLDYGLFIPIAEDIIEFVAIPWLGLTIPFGRKN